MSEFMKLVEKRLREMAAIDFRSIDLQGKFDEFNARFFNNEVLSTTSLRWTRTKSRATGRTLAKVKRSPLSRLLGRDSFAFGGEGVPVELTSPITIEMNTKLLYDESLFDLFFLHEMIHAWLLSKGLDSGHGKAFLDKAETISKQFGKTIPLRHDTDGTETVNAPAKVTGVMVWGHSSRRAFTLFNWKFAREIVRELSVRFFSFPVSVYRVETNLGGLFPVLNKYPRILKGQAMTSPQAATLDLSADNLVYEAPVHKPHSYETGDYEAEWQKIDAALARFGVSPQ